MKREMKEKVVTYYFHDEHNHRRYEIGFTLYGELMILRVYDSTNDSILEERITDHCASHCFYQDIELVGKFRITRDEPEEPVDEGW